MSALPIIVTTAGRAALINAKNNGTNPVLVARAGVSATAITVTPETAAIADEIKRVDTIAGQVVDDTTIHLVVRDESADAYTLRTFGLYLGDGTLFAVYSQANPIMEKSAQSMLMLAADIRFVDIDAADLVFGDTNFLLPPATTEMMGVVELATSAEAGAGADDRRAVTPSTMKSAVTGWLNDRFGAGAPSAFVKTLLSAASAVALRASLGLGSAATRNEGAGNGLDADLLDGQQGSYYANIPARLGYVPWGPSNDGAGSGMDADTVDGRQAAEFALLTGAAFSGPVSSTGSIIGGAFDIQAPNPALRFLSVASGITTRLGFIQYTGGRLAINSDAGPVDIRPDNSEVGMLRVASDGAALNSYVIPGYALTLSHASAARLGFVAGGILAGQIQCLSDRIRLVSQLGSVSLMTSGVDRLNITPGGVSQFFGNVGIGRNPSYALDVNGAIGINGGEVLSRNDSILNLLVGVNGMDIRNWNGTSVLASVTTTGAINVSAGQGLQIGGAFVLSRASNGSVVYVTGGSDSTAFQNAARTANNLVISDNGSLLVRAAAQFGGSLSVPSGSGLYGNGVPIIREDGGATFLHSAGANGFLIRNAGNSATIATISNTGTANFAGNITRGGNRVWDAANDGSGSGLDADLLDGLDAAAFAKVADFATGTMGEHGYQRLPSGLIIQWCNSATQQNVETAIGVSWPIQFPNQCLNVQLACRVPAHSNENDMWYQLVGTPTVFGCTIGRARSDNDGDGGSFCRLLAIGY